MLELKDLCFSASAESGTVDILKHINLTVDDGKFIVITGPNGGGKTTLAKAIMGLVTPTSGQIFWNGEEVTNLSITDRARRGISYGHDEACSYLTKVGLCARDYLSRDVDTSLSGGEVKRIEIATILAKNASLMLFDEPEAGIDLWSFARLTETFQRLHDEGGRTIIIISHQERIIRLADEILLISGGQVTGRGTADDIYPQILADTVTGCNMLEVDGTC